MSKKKTIFRIIVLCCVLVLGLEFDVNTKMAQALTQKQVKVKITTLNKEIKKLKTKKKNALAVEKKQKKGTTSIIGTLISTNPYIVCKTSLIGNVTSYYWITNSKNMTTLLDRSVGYIKLTGKYKKYNGYTCAVGKAVKVSNQSVSIQNKIDKKEKSLNQYKWMLDDNVVFFKDALYNGSIYVIQEGETEMLPWSWKSIVYNQAYNNKKYNSVKWKSSNPDIVSVNSKGEITAKKVGQVIISATCALSKKTTECPVVVIEEANDNNSNDNGNYSESDYLDIVKQSTWGGYKDQYGNNITFEEAFYSFFSNVKWYYFKSDYGDDVVEFTGNCLNNNDEEITVCIQFIVDVNDNSYLISWLDFDEEEQNNTVLNDLLYTVFSDYDA